MALSHGTNDAQKTMGVIALALITTGHLTGDVKNDGLPIWIITSCALAIGLGTYIGGWRVIRTLGKGLVEIESPQGLAAEASSAAIILSSRAAGMALSTTHVATGSILGSGVGKPGAEVRWAVAGRMAVAWLITLPAAGLPRLFSRAQLGRLQEIQSAVRCECPSHLSELVTSLAAFEEYSRGCENRDNEDAKLHAHLYKQTSRARRLLEEALLALCQYEQIEL